MQIPKRIWIFWYQGSVDSTTLIKTCMISWKLHHPDYDVVILNKNNVHRYIHIPLHINPQRQDISLQIYANFIRLALLKKYGGIWVDANVYCFQSLNNWLPALLDEKIFLFQSNFRDRINVNWFMASEPENYIINQWLEAYSDFLRRNYYYGDKSIMKIKLSRFLERLLNKNTKTTEWWLGFSVRKILNIKPYFLMHYIFNRLYHQNYLIKKIWHKVPRARACDFDMRCQIINKIKYKDVYLNYKSGKLFLLKLTHRLDKNKEHYSSYIHMVNKDFVLLLKK